MTLTIKKIMLPEQQAQGEGPLLSEHYLNLIGQVEVECHIRLGSLTLTIEQLHQLKQGQILTLQQKTQDPVDIVLNNQIIARGHIMSSGNFFAIQITEIAE